MQMTHMEMIKAIKGHGYRDELVIPIIENTPYEYELTDSLSEAVCSQYPVFFLNHVHPIDNLVSFFSFLFSWCG